MGDTNDLIRAAEAAVREITTHDLYASSITLEPGSSGWRYDNATKGWTLPVLPKVELCMFSRPEAFLDWAEHLRPERILAKRRDFDACLHFWVDRDGLTWNVNSSVRRPGSGPHLPGITVDWIRQESGRRGNEGWISLDDLRMTLAALIAVEVSVGVASDG